MKADAPRYITPPSADGVDALSALRSAGIYLRADCGGVGVCGKCAVNVNGRGVLACRETVREGDVITYELAAETSIITTKNELNIKNGGKPSFAVVDIGTTTIEVRVLDERANVLAESVAANPQRPFGADVISRAGAWADHGAEMTRLVRERVTEMLMLALSADKGIKRTIIVANTVMLSVFAGVDCTPLSRAPYDMPNIPRSLGKALGDKFGEVVTLPTVSAFIGADAYACALAAYGAGGVTLIADIGTNGEIMLINGGVIVCASAAAGPALEGGDISNGMAAAKGAVRSVRRDGDGFAVKTIGNVEPAGICGSGLVDALAEMYRGGMMDETGLLSAETEYVDICENVSITQRDVRRAQLAKAAVRAAIDRVVLAAGLTLAGVDRFIVAGGFALSNMANMVTIGLIPQALARRATAAPGNMALSGAVKWAVTGDAQLEGVHFAVVDLEKDYLFEDLFLESMKFGCF